VFREHFLTCFISDVTGVALRHEIGIDNIAWECDYPHSDSMWPSAPEQLHGAFEEFMVPDDEARKITYENAMRWYEFDPFAHIPRDEATVGALRRAVQGHDVSVRARSRRAGKTQAERAAAFTETMRRMGEERPEPAQR